MCDKKDAIVLVVDDCEDNLFLMELILAQDGYKVEKASCGIEGIEKIHQLVPDLIILDVMMPDMSGFEVVEKIKPHQHLSQIPILFCTANKFTDETVIEKVADVCYKPIDISEILRKVNSLIACCGSIKSPTLIVDVVETDDPLYLEYQQFLSHFRDEVATFELLQSQGYEIVQS